MAVEHGDDLVVGGDVGTEGDKILRVELRVGGAGAYGVEE